MTITPERMAEIRALTDAATKGPWRHVPHYSSTGQLRSDGVWSQGVGADVIYDVLLTSDAAFIAMARTAIPEILSALAAETERANRAEAVIALMQKTKSWLSPREPKVTIRTGETP